MLTPDQSTTSRQCDNFMCGFQCHLASSDVGRLYGLMSAAEQCDFWPSIGRLGVTEVARLTSADSSGNR